MLWLDLSRLEISKLRTQSIVQSILWLLVLCNFLPKIKIFAETLRFQVFHWLNTPQGPRFTSLREYLIMPPTQHKFCEEDLHISKTLSRKNHPFWRSFTHAFKLVAKWTALQQLKIIHFTTNQCMNSWPSQHIIFSLWTF